MRDWWITLVFLTVLVLTILDYGMMCEATAKVHAHHGGHRSIASVRK